MSWTQGFSILNVLQGVAAVITIGAVPIAFLGIGNPGIANIFAIYICLIASISWILLIIREFTYSRKARYAEASKSMHNSFHALKNAWSALHNNDSDDTILQFIKISLTNFSQSFTLITGVHCRVCIKQLVFYNDQAEPKERGFITNDLCRSEDEPTSVNQGIDWISDNTDFYDLLNNQKGYFFHGNLPGYKGYKNSHWTEDVWSSKKFPYVSTIVWAIRHTDQPNSDFVFGQDTIGFLCMDSKARNAFNERYDIDIGASYADVLYMILNVMLDRQSNT